ncbi:phosphatase PAP2 family protein [Dictyobacter aurantiacus]|uniref:Undecaprenyl-diphosphatase n=1 Tax=Dictyobacter aurantiacus TaxID=1936993 RepID=A0A401ZLH2_9CHLR|nr:phosphatase PAP2 family protein [Dictyobacter aurantiacus]GCE07719.1 undecaprenyl-diphosphatase [Dictyobacter aurantiacus]
MSWILYENYRLFIDINQYAGRIPFLDQLMIFGANDLIFLCPLVLLLLWGRPAFLRRRALRPGEEEIIRACRATFLWSIGAVVLAIVFNMGLSHMIFEPRPFVTHVVHLLIAHPADDSFPSDHTAVSFALAGTLVFSLPSWLMHAWKQRVTLTEAQGWRTLLLPLVLMGVAVLMACSIGIARVFVGVHYPLDIVGGAASGLAAAGIMTALRRPLRAPTEVCLRAASALHLA